MPILEMAKDSQSIKAQLLRELVGATENVGATAIGTQGGFKLLFSIGQVTRTLVSSRGGTRFFASLDTAAAFCREVGVNEFEVDLSNYEPGRLRAPRPDRSEALKKTRTRLRQQPLEFRNDDQASL